MFPIFGNIGYKMYRKIWVQNVLEILGTKCTGKFGYKMYRKIWVQNVPENILGGNGCIQSLLQLLGQSWLNDWFYIIFKRFVQRLGEQSFVFNRFHQRFFVNRCVNRCVNFLKKSWKINDLYKNFFSKKRFQEFLTMLTKI